MSSKGKTGAKGKQALNKRFSRQSQQQKYFEKLRNAQKRERDRILVRTMKLASGKGIYNPKDFKLTKYRRYKATKVAREFGEFLDPTKYFFVKAPKPIKRRVMERAEHLHMKHSRSGVFIAKEGHKRASIKYNKKLDEPYIERSGRTKRGPTKGVRYKTITPFATVDELDKERDRFRKLAKELGPLHSNERITFKVIENGLEGYSHATFSNIELLINYLEHYRKTIPAKVNFFRHIVLEKTTASQWFAEHPATEPGRRGRKSRDNVRSRIRKLEHGKRTKKAR